VVAAGERRATRITLTVVLGFALPQFGESARDDLVRFARCAEELGAASFWVGDRLLAAVEPRVGYGGTDIIPVQFRTSLDPFVALTVAAAVTDRPRLGTSTLVGPWYPPVQLGRQLTSIDVVSRGRLIAGFGIGWSPEEYRAAGVPFAGRGARLDELLDTLERIWTTNPVQHQGAHWSVPSSWIDLKPVQQPRPPIYLGAWSPAGLTRIGRRADGLHLDALGWQRRTIDAAATAAGRDPAAISTNVRVNVADGTSLDEVADAVGLLADNGYTDAFVDMMYVVTGTEAQLEWVERLLAR
jgi:probable F420-dependent oxidoreductase